MNLDISNLNRFQWTTGWTIMQPFVISGQTYLLSYKEMDGTAAIDKITPDGQVQEVKRHQWTTGWTIMQPFVISGQTYLLSYKEMDGTAAIDKITVVDD